jgi:signal transduction histidine kinase
MEKQKAVNEERLRISKDMHDELGTGLTKIALLSEVTRQGLSQIKKESSLAEISNTSRQLTQKMGEIIWTLNPINDTVDNLVSYIKEQLYELSETASLEIKFDFPAHIPAIKISNLQRQQILLVTKEGFNNILKYAEATLVEFTMKLAKDHIVFLLEDNGIGFNKDKVKAATNGRRNGLSNMEWRMLQAGGTFSIDSEPGKGTTLYYMLPLTK